MPRRNRPSDSNSLSSLPDYLAPRLKILFVGINPGRISAAAGHYYANPRNCFWRLLYEAELTSEPLGPDEDYRMLEFGYGLTDIVKRPSRGAADLRAHEFAANRQRLLRLVRCLKPMTVCFNGKTAFQGACGKQAFRGFGRQTVYLVDTPVFVLPSTSPANAAIPLKVKRRYFKALRAWLDETESKGS